MLSDDDIKNMKKYAFKSLVKSRIKNLSNEYLMSLKRKHSKCDYLDFSDCIQEPLTSNELSSSEKKLLFAMRTRTVNVKTNYKL